MSTEPRPDEPSDAAPETPTGDGPRQAHPWDIAVGVVCIVVGVLVFVLPHHTLSLIGVLLGIQLVILGLIRLFVTNAFELPQRIRLVGWVAGVVTVLAGIFCLFHPSSSLVAVTIVFGIGLMIEGVIAVAAATSGGSGHGGAIASGALTVLGGIVIVLYPEHSLKLLAQISGVILVVLGVSRLWSAFSARSAR